MNGVLFFPILIAHAVTISMNIPGNTPNSTSTPGAFVANFYQFALMIGGVLAFGVIVYGGVRYMASAGNPSGQSDAKEWIEGALLGMLLLVGAYFILNVINPQLLNLTLPALTPVTATTPGSTNTAPQSSVACGSQDANGNSTKGQCPNSSNGSVNHCCYDVNSAFGMDVGSTWQCQSNPCQ